MFLHKCAILFAGGGGLPLNKEGGLPPGVDFQGSLPLEDLPTKGSASGGVLPPPVPTSSGSHFSGRYVSYWIAFLLDLISSNTEIQKTHFCEVVTFTCKA